MLRGRARSVAPCSTAAGVWTRISETKPSSPTPCRNAASIPHTDAQWRELTRHTFIERDGKWVKHYDLGIAVPFGAMNQDLAQQGEAVLWAAYASIVAPILIVRGQESDLLSTVTVGQMLARNPRARSVEFAGVGHAPTFMVPDQIAAVVDFLRVG